MLRAWHPNHCSSHWFLCIQIFRVETSHHFKLVSSYSVICCYMNERSNLKKKIRIFLQKVLTQWAHKLHVLCLLIVSFSSLKKPEQIALLILLKFIYFLIEGWLLYRISLFSVNYQHESAIDIHMSPPSWTSLLPPSPTSLGCYKDPVWVPWIIQQIPIGYLFYIWYCKVPCYSLHTSHPWYFCFSVQTELKWNWYTYQQLRVFQFWDVIPG